jgi:MoxR-like ATPase
MHSCGAASSITSASRPRDDDADRRRALPDSSALLQEALEVFFALRDVPGLKKKPSTSELLDWLKLLLAEDIAPEALRSADRKAFIPPLHGALLKNEQDVHLFERVVFMSRAGRQG